MTPATSPPTRLRAVSAPAARILLAVSVLAACSATPASPSQLSASAPTETSVTRTQTVTPEATAAPSGPTAIRSGLAPAGTYTTTTFRPTLIFRIPSDGWMFFFKDDEDELAMGKSDVELTGGRVASVLDPTTHAIVSAPDDLVEWLASHPSFKAELPQPATVGGITGQSIDVTNPGTVDIDIFAYPTGNLRISAGTTARVWVLPYDGPDLAFCGFSPSTKFDQALPILQPIIDSIDITAG